MIAYSEQSLDGLTINEEAATARQRRLISAEEYKAVLNAYKPGLYSPNIFIRIGLFILTVVIVIMSFGFLFLIAGGASSNDIFLFIMTMMLGIAILIGLEWIVRTKKHYRSGVDDALLWLALITIVTDIGIYFELSELKTSILIFLLSLAAAIRYANSVMTAVAFCSFIAIIFYGMTASGAVGKSTLPFVVMLTGLVIYLLAMRLRRTLVLRHYRFCFRMLEFLSLITIYASVNYFVVRELSIQLFDIHLPKGAGVAGGWFFWMCTFLIPTIYVGRGLQARDHLILRVGLMLIPATLFTFRYYYSIAPAEQVMTAAGIILIIIAYAVIRYLKTAKHGFTDRPSDYETLSDNLQVESLVIAETFKDVPAPEQGFTFGGGSTGGGGATGQF